MSNVRSAQTDKVRFFGKAEQFPATPAQHVFIVDVERGAVLGGEFLRRRVSKKADLVGLGGANV